MVEEAESIASPVKIEPSLGRKIYIPQSEGAKRKVEKTVDAFREVLGDNSAELVKLLITEEKPNWPKWEGDRVDKSMTSDATVYLEDVVKIEPFDLFSYAESERDFLVGITRRDGVHEMGAIEREKLQGSARGESEANNPKLQALGKGLEIVMGAINEIVAKYPDEYNALMEQRKRMVFHPPQTNFPLKEKPIK